MGGFAGSLGTNKEHVVRSMLGVFNTHDQSTSELMCSDRLVLGYASCPDGAPCAKCSPPWFEKDGLGGVYDGIIEHRTLLRKVLPAGIMPGALSAAELILQCYKKIGPLCISLLDGSFSLALFDGNQLILAQDQAGTKPLYYGNSGDTLYFSSEHAVLRVPNVDQIHKFPAGYYYSSVKGLGPYPNFVNI